MGGDVILKKFYTPTLYWEFDANIESKADGQSYLYYKDERKKDREFMIPSTVRAVTRKQKKRIGEDARTVYMMAGDNFIGLEQNLFEIQGKFTHEELVLRQAIAYGAMKGLADSIKNKDMMKNLGLYIAIIVVVIIIVAGFYLLFNNINLAGLLP